MNISLKPEEMTDAQIFVSFYFQEVKDLAKHFLTLVSGTLVLTVTFAEKIIPPDQASNELLLLLGISWVCQIVSFLCCGFALFRLFNAAEKAVGSVIFDYPESFKELATRSARCFDLSAFAYGASLVLLASVGLVRLGLVRLVD